MKKKALNQTEKRAYIKPSISIVKVESEGLLQTLSGQHAPATHETVTPEEGSETPGW